MPDRENFTKDVVGQIKDRAAARCSNPVCRRVTRISSPTAMSSVITGDAAHIYAAAVNGPRLQGGLDPDELKSSANGVWLCKECHKLVDRAPDFFTAEKLFRWKTWAESDYNYDFVSIVASLPAHYVPDGYTTGYPWLGLHVMVAKSSLRAVCKKLTLEVMTERGTGELRARRYYSSRLVTTPEGTGFVPAPGEDWHSFALSEGFDGLLYFGSPGLNWLPDTDHAPVLFRLVMSAALEDGGTEVLSSAWDIGVIRQGAGRRVELDEFGAYADLVHFANRGPLERMRTAERALPWNRTALAQVMSIMRWEQCRLLSTIKHNQRGQLSFECDCTPRNFEEDPFEKVQCLWVAGTAFRVRQQVLSASGDGAVEASTDYGFFRGGLMCLGIGSINELSDQITPPYLYRPIPKLG